MKKQKLYFKNSKSDVCYNLSEQLDMAKFDGLKEIELIEAVENKSIKDIYWCMESLNSVDRCDCKKGNCHSYTPNNGKNGICSFRGKLYSKGDSFVFNVETGEIN